MENLESLTQKLEDIELLFASNIEAMNKIVKESNDPEKRQKEAQILNEASKRHESLLNEISGLISKEKQLIENFKPTVEVNKNSYTIDAKSPLGWVIACLLIGVMGIATGLTFWYFYNEEKGFNERLSKAIDKEEPGYMKYQYIKYTYGTESRNALQSLDKEYVTNWKNIDKKVRDMDKKVEAAERADREYKATQEEAEKEKHEADSLKNLTK